MSWTYQPERLAKGRPIALDKQDARREKLTHYLEERQKAFDRDQKRCRVYGSTAIETHHVIPRSLGGSDDADNLLSVSRRAHDEFTKHILKVEGPTDANAPLRILKWSDAEKGYVLFREAA